MSRDDWKYDEDVWDEKSAEEEKTAPREKQCRRCLRFAPVDASYCAWCGSVFEKQER